MNPFTNFLVSVFSKPEKGKTFHDSATCPECGSKLCATTGHDNWTCPNPDCPAQMRRWLAHWCAPDVMDVAGVDEKLVYLLVERGLAQDVAELYRLKVKEIGALPGWNTEAAQQLFNALTDSTKRDAWRLLFGLSIPQVGAVEAQALARGFPSVAAVFAAGVPRLMKDAKISEAAARNIVRWHSDSINRKLVRRLQKAGLNFKSESYASSNKPDSVSR